MLEKIIKKEHVKISFSFYGILTIITFLLPLAMIAVGIVFQVTEVNTYGPLWIIVGALAFLLSIRKMRDYLKGIKFAMCPKKFPAYMNLVNSGMDLSAFDKELEEAQVTSKLSKKEPILFTEHFIFGYSQVSFFVLFKDDVVWAYEYNGNGIVFLDKYKNYGFTFFPTVDGNDKIMEFLAQEMPYIYLGTDFDYKTIMHDDFDQTVLYVNSEREAFLMDKEGYAERKRAEREAKIAEEQKRLEEEKEAQLKAIEESAGEKVDEEITDTTLEENAEEVSPQESSENSSEE